MKYKIYYWLLKKSGIWRYWYEKFLNKLLYDLDLMDIEKTEIKKKYLKELLNFRENKKF